MRELEFLRPVTVSVLSERRVFAPHGMAGGRGLHSFTFLLNLSRV